MPGEPRALVNLASRAAHRLERTLLPYNERLPWVPYAIAEAGRIYQKQPYSIIFSTSPPLATQISAMWIKRRYGTKWVADLRDPLFGNPFRTRGIGRPYDAMLERLIFRNADALIANTDVVAQGWCARYPHWKHKIAVIWNGFDPEERLEPAAIPNRECRVMLHAGALYGGRNPRLLLASIDRLITRGRLKPGAFRIELLGVSEKSVCDDLSGFVRKGFLEHSNAVPRDEAIARMAGSDFLLLVDTNELNTGLQVPAKLFDYLRVGRPILTITTRNSPADRILAGSGIRYAALYSDDSEKCVDEKVLAFFALPPETTQPNQWFWKEFDGRVQARTLAELLNGLVSTD